MTRVKIFIMQYKRIFLGWNNAGRIRNDCLFDDMKTFRTNFRKAMRFCESNDMKIREEKLATSLYSNRNSKFWQEVKKMNGNISHSVIDGFNNMRVILNVFNNKFKSVFDDKSFQSNVNCSIDTCNDELNFLIFIYK